VNRHLDFFDPSISGAIGKPLERAFEFGVRRAVVVGTEACGQKLASVLRKVGFSWVESPLATFRTPEANTDLVLITSTNGADVSKALHACIDRNVVVIAPITEHHYSRRTVFLLSIPKAGTHMVIRLLNLMGLRRSPERAPLPGTWSTPVGYHYHAPCRDLLAGDSFDPMGRQLLFRSPAIFVYRNPLDIVVSELDWFLKPDHALSAYLNCCTDKAEQLDRLIADSTVMGTIRDRINSHVGWINFNNVIAVSYEELVGQRGGGSDSAQLDTIWAMQLKLQVSGSPQDYGSRLYDPASATFSKGRIGRHKECFEKRHFTLFDSLPQDFMQTLGYTRGSRISSRVKMLRQRTLVVKELPLPLFYEPRLVREGMLGWNIVEVGGRYFPVRQGAHATFPENAKAIVAGTEGFMTLRDAEDAVIIGQAETTGGRAPGVTQPELVVEGYCGFNIVCYKGGWYGFDQAAGSIDIGALGDSILEAMKRNGSCVTGETIADVKAEILRLVMRKTEQQDHALHDELTGLRSHMEQQDHALHDELTGLRSHMEQQDHALHDGLTGLRSHMEQQDHALHDGLTGLRSHMEQQDHALHDGLTGHMNEAGHLIGKVRSLMRKLFKPKERMS
jgi:hypothetical protein